MIPSDDGIGYMEMQKTQPASQGQLPARPKMQKHLHHGWCSLPWKRTGCNSGPRGSSWHASRRQDWKDWESIPANSRYRWRNSCGMEMLNETSCKTVRFCAHACTATCQGDKTWRYASSQPISAQGQDDADFPRHLGPALHRQETLQDECQKIGADTGGYHRWIATAQGNLVACALPASKLDELLSKSSHPTWLMLAMQGLPGVTHKPNVQDERIGKT